jgi:hypothetical protein
VTREQLLRWLVAFDSRIAEFERAAGLLEALTRDWCVARAG